MKYLWGGGDELSLRFIVFLLNGLFCVFTVMSEFSLDEPGLKPPGLLHQHPLPRILPWRLLLTVATSVLLVPGG